MAASSVLGSATPVDVKNLPLSQSLIPGNSGFSGSKGGSALIGQLAKGPSNRLNNVNQSLSNIESVLAAARGAHMFNNSSISVNKSSDIGTFKSARPSKTAQNSHSATPSKVKQASQVKIQSNLMKVSKKKKQNSSIGAGNNSSMTGGRIEDISLGNHNISTSSQAQLQMFGGTPLGVPKAINNSNPMRQSFKKDQQQIHNQSISSIISIPDNIIFCDAAGVSDLAANSGSAVM